MSWYWKYVPTDQEPQSYLRCKKYKFANGGSDPSRPGYCGPTNLTRTVNFSDSGIPPIREGGDHERIGWNAQRVTPTGIIHVPNGAGREDRHTQAHYVGDGAGGGNGEASGSGGVGLNAEPVMGRKRTREEETLDVPSLFDVRGRVAVITGGGTGLGLMLATALENNGAIVYIVGRRLSILEQAAAERNRYRNMIPVQCDITSRSELLRLVNTVRDLSGHVDILINNAGQASGFFPTNGFATNPAHPLHRANPKPSFHPPPLRTNTIDRDATATSPRPDPTITVHLEPYRSPTSPSDSPMSPSTTNHQQHRRSPTSRPSPSLDATTSNNATNLHHYSVETEEDQDQDNDHDPTTDILNVQQTLWSSASPVDFARAFETNVTGAYYTTVAFLELLHKGNTRHTHPEGVVRRPVPGEEPRMYGSGGRVAGAGVRGGGGGGEGRGGGLTGQKFAEARGSGSFSFFGGTLDGRKLADPTSFSPPLSSSSSPQPPQPPPAAASLTPSGVNIGAYARPVRSRYEYGRTSRSWRMSEGFEGVTSQVIMVSPVEPECRRQLRRRRSPGREGREDEGNGTWSGGRQGEEGGGYSVPYTLSQVAAGHLGKMMAGMLKEWDIRCNTIAPGIFDYGDRDPTSPSSPLNVPLGRSGTIDDIAGLILFLASRAGAYVDGATHVLDGGGGMMGRGR